MTTNPHAWWMDERPADKPGPPFRHPRTADLPAFPTRAGTVIDEAPRRDDDLPRALSFASQRVLPYGWTDAHSEAVRFLGECFAVGAVLGLVTEVVRPMRGKRHG